MTDGTVNNLLVGGNFTLCSLDSILEYCFKQIQENRAAIIAYSNIPNEEKETIYDYLSSPLHLVSDSSFGVNRGCYGYHMTITPFHDETVDDEEAVVVAKERICKTGTTSRPWVLIKEVAIKIHYHLITTVSYPEGFNYEKIPFQERQGNTHVQPGQICPHKGSGNLLHVRSEHGQIANLKRLFEIALKFDYYNYIQFSSILHLQGIGVDLDIDNERLNVYQLRFPKRASYYYRNDYWGKMMYKEMMLHMRTKERKKHKEDIARVERIVSEAFYLGVDFCSYLKEFGIIADLSNESGPVYVDSIHRRVYEHKDFDEFFTLEKYRHMVNEDKWYRSIYDPLSFGSDSLFPIIRIAKRTNKKKWAH